VFILIRKLPEKAIGKIPILIIPTIFLVLYFCISFPSRVSAEYGGLNEITSVEPLLVEKGDTLSAISKRYAPEYSYITAKEYMQDILELNNLHSEHIQAGKYILLPNYRNET
jgi:LysM domain.